MFAGKYFSTREPSSAPAVEKLCFCSSTLVCVENMQVMLWSETTNSSLLRYHNHYLCQPIVIPSILDLADITYIVKQFTCISTPHLPPYDLLAYCFMFSVWTLPFVVLWNTRNSTLHFVSIIDIKLAQCSTVRAQNHSNLTQSYLVYGWSGNARKLSILIEYSALVYLIYSRIRFWRIRICCIWIIIPLFLYRQRTHSEQSNV